MSAGDATPAGVVVVGMHRSGTSALTGALRRLGLDAGDDAALIGRSAFNESGHHEILDVVMHDELLLQQLGGTWFAPPPYDAEAMRALAASELGRGSGELLTARLVRRPWVWKDPRVSLLLPYWRAVLGDGFAVVTIVREPWEVARSLMARNRVDAGLALALWEHYTRSAVLGAAGVPAFLVRYADLVGDPMAALDAVAAFLGDLGLLPPGAAVTPAAGSIEGRTPGAAEPPAELPPGVEALHRALAGQRGRFGQELAASLPPPSPDLAARFDEARRAGYDGVAAARRKSRPAGPPPPPA